MTFWQNGKDTTDTQYECSRSDPDIGRFDRCYRRRYWRLTGPSDLVSRTIDKKEGECLMTSFHFYSREYKVLSDRPLVVLPQEIANV